MPVPAGGRDSLEVRIFGAFFLAASSKQPQKATIRFVMSSVRLSVLNVHNHRQIFCWSRAFVVNK